MNTLTTHASANYATMPKRKRILAAFLALVLAVSMIPFAPVEKAYAATYAQSAGSKTVTRTVQFQYSDESTPFQSVDETFVFSWARGARLDTFGYTFPERNAADYWTSYPATWTFNPTKVPAKTVYADTAENFTVLVKINRNTQAQGAAVITYVDETGAEIPGTRFTVNDVYTGMPFTTTFSGGDYAGKSIIDVVQETIDRLSPAYELVENPITANGSYTAGTTYKVKMRKNGTSNIDTSVSIVFVDQYNNKIVAPDGYYAEINVGNNPATNGIRYNAVYFSDGSGTLIDNVNAKKQTLINAGYQFVSSEFPENGSYGPTKKTYYVHMKRPGNEEIQISGPADVVYNGSEQKPRPTLTYNGQTLVEGTDYTLYYPGTGYKLSNSDPDWIWPGGYGTDSVNVGNKEVHIVGKGLYSGFTAIQEYRILPMNITVTPSQTEFTANGQVQRPSLTVTDANGNNVPASGYITTWQNYNSTGVGTYTVTVEGKGNYTGGGEVAYVINAAPAPTKIDLSNAEVTLEYVTVEYDGYVHKPAVTSVKVNGTEVPASEYTVSYQDDNTCTQNGNKTVTITAKSGSTTYTGSTQKGYQITKVPLSRVTANVPDQTHTGSAITPAQNTIRVTYKGNNNVTSYTIEGYNNNVNAYTYNPKPGALETAGSNPVVHVKATSNSNFTGEAYFPFNIISTATPPKSINDQSITVTAPANVTYNGASQTMKPVVKDGTKTLVEGTDYTLQYSDNTTDAGTVTVTIIGTGAYTGARTTSYQIHPAAITSVSAADQTYDGTNKEPVPVVKAGNLTVPTNGYTATYANNKEVGTATVTVTGTGNFTGTESATFQIRQAVVFTTVTVNFVDENNAPLTGMTNPVRLQDYSGNALNSTLVEFVDNVIEMQKRNYECTDRATWDALKNTGTQPASNQTINIKFKQRAALSVSIKIYTGDSLRYTFGPIQGTNGTPFSAYTLNDGSGRTLIDAVDAKVAEYQAEGFDAAPNWDGWNTDKNGNLRADKLEYNIRLSRTSASASDFTIELTPASATYNGWPQRPTLKVTDKSGKVLTQGSDYTVSWLPNTTFQNVGDYTVTVTGREANGYTGTKTAIYKINKAKIASVELSSNSAVYDGKDHKPTFTVKDADGNVVSSANYNATWTPNSSTFVNEGTYTLNITSKGNNYTGSATATFTITKDPLSDMANITVTPPADVPYNGTSQRLKPVVKKTDGTTLKEGTDYTLSYSTDTTNAGTVTITVAGKGAYTGSKQVTYKINKADLSKAAVGAVSNYPYNGDPHTPSPTITYSGHTPSTLSVGTDYTLKYENNVNTGTAKVWAEGNGNYMGSTAKKNFTISKANLASMDAIANVAYDGTAKTPAVKVYNSAGRELAEGTDYTVAYTNNTNVGTATATVTGKGNYQGTLSRNFQIYNTDTGTTNSTVNVYFKNADGTLFSFVSPNPYPVTGAANAPINSAYNTQINNLLNNFASTYDIDKSEWDSLYNNGSGTMPNNNNEIDILLTPLAKHTVSVTIKTVDGNTTNTNTHSIQGTTNQKFTDFTSNGQPWPTYIDGLVQAKINDGFTQVAGKEAWDAAKTGNIPVGGASYTITLTKPSSSPGSDPTPAVESTIRVTVEDPAGSATYSATANQGTAISNTSLDANVQARIDARKALGYTEVKSDTWTAAKNGTFGATGKTYKIVLAKPGEPDTPTPPANPVRTYVVVKLIDEDGKNLDQTWKWNALTNVRLTSKDTNGNSLAEQVEDKVNTWKDKGYQVTDRTAWDAVLQGVYYPEGGTSDNPKTYTIKMNSGKKSIDSDKNSSITIKVDPQTKVYNGNRQVPTITVKNGSTTLREGTDYTVSWASGEPKNVGTYTATITGINGYKDSKNVQFSITPKSVAKPTVKTGLVYNGIEQEGVTPGADAERFTLSGNTQTNAGTYTATATLKDKTNYQWAGGGTDDLKLTFTIAKKKIAVPTGKTFTFNGSSQGPGVASGEGYTVSTDSSYTNSYTSATSAGTYNLKVTPTTNYQWTDDTTAAKKVSWKINPAQLTSVTASNQTYDGTEKKPALTVKSSAYSSNITTESGYLNSAYKVMKWENNVNAGTAKVTVEGTGNFTGQVSGTFTIAKSKIAKPTASNKTYTGSEQTGVAAGNGYTLSGTPKATAVGTYNVTASLKDTTNTTWSDGTTSNLSLTWKIIPKSENTSVRVDFVDTATGKAVYQTGTWYGTTQTPITASPQGSTDSLKKQVDVKLTQAKNDGWTIKDQSAWDAIVKTGYYPAGGNADGTAPKVVKVTMSKPASAKTDLAGATVTLNPTSYTYNGTQQRPAVTVKVGNTTVPSSEYTINWPADTTNAGTKSVTVTAKSTSADYKGTSPAATYKINPKPISASTVTITLSPTSYNYDGKAKTPTVTANDTATNKTLVKDTDYTVAYENNTNVGTGKATITGKGNYTGTTTRNFTIVNPSTSSTQVNVTVSYVDDKGANLGGVTSTGTANTMRFSATDANGNSLAGLVTSKISEQQAKGYTVKSMGGFDPNGYYPNQDTSYTIVFTKPEANKTDLADATITFSPKEYTYNGAQQRPAVTVKVGNTTVPSSEYTINWPADTTNAGTKSVTVTAKSTSVNYKGTSPAATYKINPTKVAKPTASNKEYNGKEQIGVASGNYNLTGTPKATAVGTYNVTASLKDKNNYTWSDGTTTDVKLTWNIVPKSEDTSVRVDFIDASTGKLVAQTSTWRGKTTARITTTNPSGDSLKKQVDDRFANAKKAGWTVKDQSEWDAVAKAGYYPAGGDKNGNAPKVIKITMSKPNGGGTTPTQKIDIAKLDKTRIGMADTYVYTGSQIKPKPRVVVNGKTLVEGKDYTVSYKNNVNVGNAQAIITGKGDYTGTYTRNFTIIDGKKQVERLWGNTAIGTMDKIVNEGFRNANTVVIATNNGYWDALAASSLAGKYNAPVLLTDPNNLTKETANIIRKLGATQAFVCGGPVAVSEKVFNQVKTLCSNTKRLWGTTAIGTAIAIAGEVGNARADTCIVATSNGHWDALSASPYAYAKVAPIYLTNLDGTLSPETLAAIARGGYKRVVIAGGTAAVAASTESNLQSVVSHVLRKAGKNCYGTSGDFAEWAVSEEGMVANNIGVATADGYWDALTGGALCGKNNAVLVLADDPYPQNITGFMNKHRKEILNAYVFGGEKAIGPKTFAAVQRVVSGT